MADISAKIKIHTTGNGTIDNIETNYYTNNVSAIPFSSDIISWAKNLNNVNLYYGGLSGSDNDIKQLGLFKLGSTRLGIRNADGTYSENYKGVIFGYTNASKVFALTLTFEGIDMGSLKIKFDPTINNYPTSYTVKETVGATTATYNFSNNTNIINITNLSGNATKIEMIFSSWYKANSPVAITFIENQTIDLLLNKIAINSFESENQMTSSPSEVSPSIIANTGSLNINDIDNEIYNKASLGYLKMNTFEVELYINENKIQSHIVVENPYYSADKTMQIETTNKIARLNTYIPERTFTSGSTLYSLLVYIFTTAGFVQVEIDNMILNDDFHSRAIHFPSSDNDRYAYIKRILTSTTFDESFVLKEGTLSEQIQKICLTLNLNFYIKDISNDTINFAFVSNRPVINCDNSNIIVIPFRNQVTHLSYDIFVNNNYNKVQFANAQQSNNYNVLDYGINEILSEGNPYIEYNEDDEGYILEILESELLDDYSNGLKTATIDIFPNDFYYMDDNIAKDWSNGEIINVGDIVNIVGKDGEAILKKTNNEEVYWQVTGKKIRYEGQVIETLTLREVIQFEE